MSGGLARAATLRCPPGTGSGGGDGPAWLACRARRNCIGRRALSVFKWHLVLPGRGGCACDAGPSWPHSWLRAVPCCRAFDAACR